MVRREPVDASSKGFYGNITHEGCCDAIRNVAAHPNFDAYHHMWPEQTRITFKEDVKEQRFGLDIFNNIKDLPLICPYAPYNRQALIHFTTINSHRRITDSSNSIIPNYRRVIGYTQMKGMGTVSYELGGGTAMQVEFGVKQWHGIAGALRMYVAGMDSEDMRALNNGEHANLTTVSHEFILPLQMGRNGNPLHVGMEGLEVNKARNSDKIFFARLNGWDASELLAIGTAMTEIQILQAAGIDVNALNDHSAIASAAEDVGFFLSIGPTTVMQMAADASDRLRQERQRYLDAQMLCCSVAHAADTYPRDDGYSHICRVYDGPEMDAELFTATNDKIESARAMVMMGLAVPLKKARWSTTARKGHK